MVIVWGEVLWDRFPDGDQLGGAPSNVAWHLAGLGGAVQLVTATGADADGDRARARLADRGVELALAQVDPDHATGEVTVALVDGEPRYRLVPDRAWEHIAMTDAIAAALPGARAIVYGTLAQRTPAGRCTGRPGARLRHRHARRHALVGPIGLVRSAARAEPGAADGHPARHP